MADDKPILTADATTTDAPAETGFRVFVGNLTYETDEDALKVLFSNYSNDVTNYQIIRRFKYSSGFGFVTFQTEETAKKACTELDKTEKDGRTIIVEIARPSEYKPRPYKKRFSGRRGSKAVPGEATEAAATEGETAAPTDGAEAAPKKKKKAPRKPKKKTDDGPTEAGTITDAAAPTGTAANDDGAATETKAERVKKPRNPKPRQPRTREGAPPGELSKSVLFVANLSFSVDEAALQTFFTENGVNVKSARVVRWRWGTPRKSKGYAFVDVGDEEEQKKAMEAVQGKTIDDREVTVKIAVDSKRRGGEENGDEGTVTEANEHAAPPTSV